MAAKKPLVLNGGQIEQLQTGDTLDASVSEVDVVSVTNGESTAVVICTPVYVSAAGAVKKAQANASGTVQLLGLMKSTSVEASATGTVQTDGIFTATTAEWDVATGGTGGLTAGSVYYLSAATAGLLTTTPPSATGSFIDRVGLALSTTDLDITIEPPIKL